VRIDSSNPSTMGCRSGTNRRHQSSMSEWLAEGSGDFRPAFPLIAFGIASPPGEMRSLFSFLPLNVQGLNRPSVTHVSDAGAIIRDRRTGGSLSAPSDRASRYPASGTCDGAGMRTSRSCATGFYDFGAGPTPRFIQELAERAPAPAYIQLSFPCARSEVPDATAWNSMRYMSVSSWIGPA
jgi:hypothetical protein